MKIRRVNTNDIESIFYIDKITWINTYSNKEYSISIEDIKKRFKDKNKFILKIKDRINNYSKNEKGWVLELNNKIIGYSVILNRKNKYTIGGIYILPEYQGVGYGKKMLLKIFDFCKTLTDELYLDVAIYNKKAINFYKKFGFKIINNSEGKHRIIDDKYMITIEMIKKIKLEK